MGRRGKKKPFIDKDKAESFVMAPRSQRDPRFYDEDASQYVLLSKKHQHVVGVDDQGKFTSIPLEEMAKSAQPRKEGKAISTIDEMGFPLDGYDYHQHLRGRIPGGIEKNRTPEDSTVITSDGQIVSTQDQFDYSVDDSASGSAAAASSSQNRGHFSLPQEALPSYEEIDRDEMLESITVSGKSLPPAIYHALEEWDPDNEPIHEDEEGEQEYEELNDDFIMHATGEKEIPEEWMNEEEEENFERDNGGLIGDFGIPGFDYDAHIAKLMAKAEEEDRKGGAIEQDDDDDVEGLEPPASEGVSAAERNQLDSYLDVVLAQYDDMYIGEGIDEDEEEEQEDADEMEDDKEGAQDEGEDYNTTSNEENGGSGEVKTRGFRVGEYVPGYGRVVGAAFAENKTSKMTADKDDEVALAEKEAVESAIEEFQNTKVDATAVIEEGREVTQQLSRFNDGEEVVAPYGWGEQDHSQKKETEELKKLESMFLQKKSKPKWDAETVVSTYTNLDNHPKVVNSKKKSLLKPHNNEEDSTEEQPSAADEKKHSNSGNSAPSAAFKVSIPSSGGPLESQKSVSDNPSQKDPPQAEFTTQRRKSDEDEEAEDESTGSGDDRIERHIPVRNPKETREEKKYRKQLAKEQRRQRRLEKKQLKKAFKTEEERQTKQQIGESRAAGGVPAGTSVFGV